jgi:GNAT superfamily N-acetyltransferase
VLAQEVALERISKTGPDRDAAAMVAARAFHHDPFFEFLDPRGITRARALALFWRTALASLGPTAQLTGARHADGRLLGVAAVVPPGGHPLPVANQLREGAGAVRAMILRPRGLVQASRYLTAIERAHPREPLWYLFLLVVDPLLQRSGLGSRLQQEMLDTADSDGLDCYLETQKPENVPYYRRFGYEVEKELCPVPGGPPLWTMRRPTKSSGLTP